MHKELNGKQDTEREIEIDEQGLTTSFPHVF